MKKELLTYFVLCCLSAMNIHSKTAYTLSYNVQGVKKEVISLNGNWNFQYAPNDKWVEVKVPGELAMQGYAIKHDVPTLYTNIFNVPSDFENKQIVLRFDGVYSYARLWINGKFVREHTGGFTRWETDVTPYIKIGSKNEIKLEITDPLQDISYASGYAHHPIGGILRDVTLYALPKANLQDFFFETLLSKDFQKANLRLCYTLSKDAEVFFELKDRNGHNVATCARKESKAGNYDFYMPVESPTLWDAEHPNLYTLETKVKSKDDEYTFSRKVGFRDIQIKDSQMFVNGHPVKLRGACRHDMHPYLGRISTPKTDYLDAILIKESNMNFVRTSHYPPSERFVSLCDSLGIYVECETAVCFVDTYRQKNYAPGNSQNDTTKTKVYLGQLEEMTKTMRSHSSVLFWSIGNESMYGTNFQLSYDWMKKADKTRPVIFSYPGPAKEYHIYDLLSMHYPGCSGTMNQLGVSTSGFQGENIPALFDEWAHVPCYTYTTLQNDNNIRDFWGISLDKMWSGLFESKGGLGGAIWCYSDETFMVPAPKKGAPFWIKFAHTAKPIDFEGKCVGYGEWGVVDVWRRKKPEFWGTKKAYSPIRLLTTEVKDITPGQRIYIPVYNRFDHTNLNEVMATITYQNQQQKIVMPAVKPHQKGVIIVPAKSWKDGESMKIEFYDSTKLLIDVYAIQLGKKQVDLGIPAVSDTNIELIESEKYVTLRGNGFEIPFNKESGLIENATSKGKVIIERGPFLNLDLNTSHKTGAEVREKARNYIVSDTEWQKEAFSYKLKGNSAEVSIKGHYKGINVDVLITVNSNGIVDFDYSTSNEPNGWLREAGLKFYMPDTYSAINWQRKGYWSYYPENSFAGNIGHTDLYNAKNVKYGEDPNQPWSMDTRNYYYFADKGAICDKPLTNSARAMKENIYTYSLVQNNRVGIKVISQSANLGCRLNKNSNEQLILYINNRWDYPEIAWGDYCKSLDVTPVYGSIKLVL